MREIYTRYKETARPRLFPVSPAFLRTLGLTDLAAELAQKYAYDFEKGKAVIQEEMTKLGAVLRDNVWYYKNVPVKVKIIGRTEDERKPLAEYIALQLKKPVMGQEIVTSLRSQARVQSALNLSALAVGTGHTPHPQLDSRKFRLWAVSAVPPQTR